MTPSNPVAPSQPKHTAARQDGPSLLDRLRLPRVQDSITETYAEAADRIEELEVVLRPFAEISLLQDHIPDAQDMIDGPDLAITPKQVRAARAALPKQEPGDK